MWRRPRTALEGGLNLAIRLGHEAITDVLLANAKFDFRQIHEALLVAVDTNQPAVVRHLLARLNARRAARWTPGLPHWLSLTRRSMPPASPRGHALTLACQKDLYEVAQPFMGQGHTIARPHPASCACLECSTSAATTCLGSPCLASTPTAASPAAPISHWPVRDASMSSLPSSSAAAPAPCPQGA